MPVYIVLTTLPSKTAALRLIRPLLKNRLIACAHLHARGESHYRWKNRIEKTREISVTLKTTKKTLPSLLRTIKQTHPYETPEILALRVRDGDVAYMEWLRQEIRPEGHNR